MVQAGMLNAQRYSSPSHKDVRLLLICLPGLTPPLLMPLGYKRAKTHAVPILVFLRYRINSHVLAKINISCLIFKIIKNKFQSLLCHWNIL